MVLGLKIQYDGTNYSGWQIQNNAISIQQRLELAVSTVIGNKVKAIGAGRTDTGVHARAQVASFNLENPIRIPPNKLSLAINSKLPYDIRIVETKMFDRDFHARFDAIAREYSYSINTKENVFNNRFSTFIKYKLDLDLLWDSAKIFRNTQDFTTFSKLNPDSNNPVCHVMTSRWDIIDSNTFVYSIKSNHFLYGMVRSILGAMIDVARGKRTLPEIEQSLTKKDRSLNSPLISAKGLILEKISYPENFDF